MTAAANPRPASALDQACDSYVSDLAKLSPLFATAIGDRSNAGELDDFTPEYYASWAARTRQLFEQAQRVHTGAEPPADHVDKVTAAVVVDRLGAELSLYEAGESERALDNISSPVQQIRDVFNQMDYSTPTGAAQLRERLSQVPRSFAGYRASLELAASRGQVAAQRQIRELQQQLQVLVAPSSPLRAVALAAGASETEYEPVAAAAAELSDWLGNTLAPQAPLADGVGEERYARFSWARLGMQIDQREAYSWAWQQLAQIIEAQQQVAQELYGHRDEREAMRALNSEARYRIHGVENLHQWLQQLADQAVSDLNGTHFNIPPEVQQVEARIDPAGSGGIFYTPPTEDFSRPGRIWWSVPPEQQEFYTWQELTTVYHEGVPGHHLQFGATMMARSELNRWRQVACWNSGHGEGWALYAEQLMDELGYHDPGTRMGLLDAQRMRAVRVIIDIGLHLGLQIPTGASGGAAKWAGQVWDFELADKFFAANVAGTAQLRHFELHRYAGWPGQAPTYALGQRAWLDLRAAALAQGQSLPDFHARALALGSIPLDILREEVLRQP